MNDSRNVSSSLRLADGLIFVRGHRDAVADVPGDRPLDLAPPDLETVAQVCLGTSIEDTAAEGLLAAGVLVENRSLVDVVLHKRLAALDAFFLSAYGPALSKRAQRAYELTLAAHAQRKQFMATLGQCPALPETALRRALLIGDAREVGTLEVLCVGDDDLVCVAAAALGHRVTVLDADPYLLALLRQTSAASGLEIRVQPCDLTRALPAEVAGSFDVFLADPMPNEDCFELFLSRGFCQTRRFGRAFLAVCAPARGRLLAVAQRMGLRIVSERARHNRYHTQYYKLHPYESDWIEIDATPAMTLPYPAERCCPVPSLYGESYFHRRPIMLGYCERVFQARFDANPEMLLRLLESHGHFSVQSRRRFDLAAVSIVGATTNRGFVTIRLDRAREDLSVEIFPYDPELIEAMEHVVAGFSQGKAKVGLQEVAERWDLRVSV